MGAKRSSLSSPYMASLVLGPNSARIDTEESQDNFSIVMYILAPVSRMNGYELIISHLIGSESSNIKRRFSCDSSIRTSIFNARLYRTMCLSEFVGMFMPVRVVFMLVQ